MSNSREKIHQSAIQWLEEKSNNYTFIKALKHIPNTKKEKHNMNMHIMKSKSTQFVEEDSLV